MVNYNILVAEDVRIEPNGKMMLIGLFHEIMLVGKFPLILPKLAFVPIISGKNPLPSKVKWVIELNENKIEAEMEIIQGNQYNLIDRNVMMPGFGFQCIEITEETDINIQAFVEDEIVFNKVFPIRQNGNVAHVAPPKE